MFKENISKMASRLVWVVCSWVMSFGLSLSHAQGDAFHLKDFRIEGVGAFGNGNSYSAIVSYLPRYSVLSQLDIKGNIGASLYKGANALTPVINAGLLVGYQPLSPLLVELGGGLQVWTGSGSAPIVNGNLAWVPEVPILGRVHKVVAGYSRAFFEAPVNEVRVGVEFNFDTLFTGATRGEPSVASSTAAPVEAPAKPQKAKTP